MMGAGAAVVTWAVGAGVNIGEVEPATTTYFWLPEVTTTTGVLSMDTVVPIGTMFDPTMTPGMIVALPLMVVVIFAD